MLEGFDNSFIKLLTNLKAYYEIHNEAKFREEAFTLMATSGYLAAGRVYHTASKIHGAFMRKEYSEEFSYYPQLIEESIALRIEIQEVLAKKKGIVMI